MLGRNAGSCNDGNLFVELSSFVMLGPGRYKHRLELGGTSDEDRP